MKYRVNVTGDVVGVGDPLNEPATISDLTGDFFYNGATGEMAITNFVGTLDTVSFDFSGFMFELDGTVEFNIDGFANGEPDPDPPIFTDGFESGDTSAWSTTVP